MKRRIVISTTLIGSLLTTSSTGLQADDRLKKDRRRMAVGMASVTASPLVMAVGVLSFNPVIAGAGVAMFGAGTGLVGVGGGGYIAHKMEDRRAREASSITQSAQVETLLPVPQWPGYYYYPSNPNQFYVDQAQVAESMAPKPETPTLVTVKVANAAKDGRSIDCTVDGMRFSVPPGYTQTLTAAPGAVISYDGGGEVGVQRYSLTEGGYEFRSVENTWKFYNQAPDRSMASVSTPTTGVSVPR